MQRRLDTNTLITLFILNILQFSDVHADSLPIDVEGADACCDFLRMPTHGGMSGSALLGEFGEDAWMASQARSDSLLNAGFRSCSSRCSSLLSAQIGRSYGAS